MQLAGNMLNTNPDSNLNPNSNQDVQLAGNMLGRAVLQGYTLRAREVTLVRVRVRVRVPCCRVTRCALAS